MQHNSSYLALCCYTISIVLIKAVSCAVFVRIKKLFFGLAIAHV